MEQRGGPLVGRELDEGGPVDGASGQLAELALGPRVEARPRSQQEQRGYDVALVRCDFPIVVRWLFEQVAPVARQHVVVSAPKMLLGSSVGFS
jgi:hypothetical protein